MPDVGLTESAVLTKKAGDNDAKHCRVENQIASELSTLCLKVTES